MPQIPVYPAPQVREQALAPVYQSNVDVSKDTIRMGEGIASLGVAAARQADLDAQAKAYDVENQVTTEWLKWDSQARAQFRGEKVDGYAPAAEEWWAKAADTYGKDLDPRARALASRGLSTKRTSAIGSVLQFSGAEKERHADEVSAASINSTIQFGVTTGDVAGAAQQVRDTVAATAARKGWTTEQLAAATTGELGKLHGAQIDKLLESDPAAAQAYYNEVKARNEIPAAAQAHVEKLIKGETDNQFATQFAAQNAALPLDQQLAAAGEIKDPDRREKALLQIKNNHAMIKEAQRAREDQFADQAWQLVGAGKRVPESILAGMDGKERVQLQEHIAARAERLAAGKPVKTDMATYIDLRERLAAGEKINLKGYTEKIAPGQMEQLLDIQLAAKKPGDPKQDSMLTDEARIGSALTGLGIDKKKNPEAAGLFASEVDRRVRAASAAKGDKPLSPDEKQTIIDSVAMDKVFVDEWGRDPQKPLTLLKPEELGAAYVVVNGKDVPVSSVPLADRTEIIRARRARGLIVTEQTIVETYLKAHPETKKPSPVPYDEVADAASGRRPALYASKEAWAAYNKWQTSKQTEGTK